MRTHNITTRKLAFAALMAALTAVASALRVKVPLDISGFSAFHLGNIMCALSGVLLGPWLGGAAAGIGSALHDIIFDPSYISECWLTFLMKGAYGIASGLICSKKGVSYLRSLMATVCGAVTYAILYLAKSYFYSGLLISGLTPDAALLNLVGKLPATFFNAVIAIVCAPLLAIAISKALEKNHLQL